jgi:uncharacterized protein (DUF2164 family)
MTARRGSKASRVQLTPERRAVLVKALTDHFATEFDEPLSPFRADALLDLVLRELGPSLYNQGVRDALAAVPARVADIEAEITEPEPDS